MSTKIAVGHQEAHEKLTGRLFWKKRNESGYNDAGNVKDYMDASSRSLVTRSVANDGFRRVNDEQVDVEHLAWTFTLDERDAQNEVLLRLAKQASDTSQAQGEGTSASITNVKQGRWHTIGSYNIENVTATSTFAGALTEGVDYEINKPSGRILIISGGQVSDGETVTLLFDRPALTLEAFDAMDSALFYGDVIIEEYNQFSKVWLRRITFVGNINVTEFPGQTGDFGVFKVKVTPSTKPNILKRHTSDTLATPTATTEGPGKSSSSSSSSSRES